MARAASAGNHPKHFGDLACLQRAARAAILGTLSRRRRVGAVFAPARLSPSGLSGFVSKEILSTDVVVIGAGPVGLFTVFQCGMLKINCHVIDTLDMVGGQCAALYPEKPIYDIPGHPVITGQALIDQLEKQAAPFDTVYHLSQQVTAVCRVGERWRVTTSKGRVLEAKAVVLAAGVGAFGPNRPPLEGLEAYEGRSVFYMVAKPEAFRGKKVVIAGGGDTALDWSLILADVAEKVYVIHRRPKFRGAPESVARLHYLAESGRIELVVPYQLHGLEGDQDQLTGVVVRDLDGNTRTLEADRLLPGPTSCRGRSADPANQLAGLLCGWRYRPLSQQAEADPDRLCRGGHGGSSDLQPGSCQ